MSSDLSASRPSPGTSDSPAQSRDDSGAATGQPFVQAVRGVLNHYAILGALIVVVAVCAAIHPDLLQPDNLRNLLSQNAAVGVVALGVTFVLIAGGFDLSVGSVVGAGAVVAGSVANHHGLAVTAAVTLAMGVIVGLFNAFTTLVLNVNPFVATLGSGSLVLGAAALYSNDAPEVVTGNSLNGLGQAYFLTIPVSVVLVAILFVLGGLILSRTVYGRGIYAVGGNLEAARLVGLRVSAIRGSTYVLASTFAAFAGLILVSIVGSGQSTTGASMTLDSIAMVIIGGTSLMGGEGAVWRTAVGLLMLATLGNLFDSLEINSNTQSLVKGGLLILAVAVDTFVRRRRR